MNEWQLLRRLKTLCIARKWRGSGDRVFAPTSILISAGVDAEQFWPWVGSRLPALILQPDTNSVSVDGRGSADQVVANIHANLIVGHIGDRFGEHSMMGAHRVSATTGRGRGLLEVATELLAAIQEIRNDSGVYIQHVATGAARAETIGKTHMVARVYRFEAHIGTAEAFLHPRNIAVVNAAGTVTISWLAPDDVTDLVTYVVRRTTGIVPVARIDEGTAVAMGSALDLSTTDTPGSGTFTYSVFAHYGDPGKSVALNPSDCGFGDVTVA